MKEQLITFETAKLANKKKFIGWSESRYNRLGLLKESKAWSISAPTQSLLQKWLRDNHKIHTTITSVSQESWMFRVTLKGQTLNNGIYEEDFDTYEEALEISLQEALKLI